MLQDFLQETAAFLESRHEDLNAQIQELQDKLDEVTEAQSLLSTLESTHQELVELLDTMKED